MAIMSKIKFCKNTIFFSYLVPLAKFVVIIVLLQPVNCIHIKHLKTVKIY